MIVFHQVVAAAIKNGSQRLQIGASPTERMTQVEAVVQLLATSTSPAAQPAARLILREMGARPWFVIRGVHVSPADPTPHVTVETSKRRYHLRVEARGCVFDITYMKGDEPIRLTGREPWLGPGA